MQIGRWDTDDGVDLLERVQRHENFKYLLKRKVEAIRAVPIWTQEDVEDVLRHLLAQLVAPKQLAEWLDRAPARVTHIEAVMGLAEAANYRPSAAVGAMDVHTTIDSETGLEAWIIRQPGFVPIGASEPGIPSFKQMFGKLSKSARARDALAKLINIVVIPILEKEISPTS